MLLNYLVLSSIVRKFFTLNHFYLFLESLKFMPKNKSGM